MNKTLEDIRNRKSIRRFSPSQITEEELSAILEAGRAAPSSRNLQPWYFTVIQNKELLDRMVNENKEIVLASPELTQIAPWVNAPNYHNYYHAPTVILISGDVSNIWHVCDCALAMQNMSLAAEALSIGTCIVVSTRFLFKSEKATGFMNELGIPQGYVPLYALSVGYMDGSKPDPTPRKEDYVNYIR